MEVELAEIRNFLQRCAPFDSLPKEVLDDLPRQLTVVYLRRGSPFPPRDRPDRELYILRTGAVELRDSHGTLLDKIAEREVYAGDCLPHQDGALQGHAVEDSLVYTLPCERFQALQTNYLAFNEHFHESTRVRLVRAMRELSQTGAAANGWLQVRVGDLINRAPVSAPPEQSIREGARLMTEQRVSALLIMREKELVGLTTDRDLRTRCVAVGLSIDEPLEQIMSRRVHTISANASGFDALMTMARLHIHHLPVTDRGTVAGLISHSDLIRQQRGSALHLADDLRRCDSTAQVQQTCAGMQEMFLNLVNAGTTAYHLGQLMSSVADAATRRLVELAERRLGPPPVPYCWLAAGSHGREEQSARSDQDNALVLSDDYRADAHGEYFIRLARTVSDGLNACGMRYCPGEIMASTDQWRQPVRTWRQYFADWIEHPTHKALMLCANFFDLRPVAGEASLYESLQNEALQKTAGNQIFLAHMAAIALENRPPLGFFRQFVLSHHGEHDDTLDLKLGGIVPIVSLARVAALAEGVTSLNTFERLRECAGGAAISASAAADLEDALELLGTLRARHQAGQIRRGEQPDNYLAPKELTPRQRSHLKEAFTVIRTVQSVWASRYQVERFLT